MTTVTERNASQKAVAARADAARLTLSANRNPGALPRLATDPTYFAPLADSVVFAEVAEQARLVTVWREAAAAAKDHARLLRAAQDADADLNAASVAEGTDDPGTPNLDAHRAEAERLDRRAAGAKDALFAATHALVTAIADHEADLTSACEREAAQHREALVDATAKAAEAAQALDRLAAFRYIVRNVSDRGVEAKPRQVLPAPVMAVGPRQVFVPELLAVVAAYREEASK